MRWGSHKCQTGHKLVLQMMGVGWLLIRRKSMEAHGITAQRQGKHKREVRERKENSELHGDGGKVLGCKMGLRPEC